MKPPYAMGLVEMCRPVVDADKRKVSEAEVLRMLNAHNGLVQALWNITEADDGPARDIARAALKAAGE